jgi:hypothetical protein
MFAKSRTLAVGVTVAGLIGFGAAMASASPIPGGIGNNANVAVPVCGNDVNANVAAIQALVPAATLAGNAGSAGATTSNTSLDNRGCVVANVQKGYSQDGGILNNANVAVPVCGNDVNVSALAAQADLSNLTALLNLFSPGATASNTSVQNRGCVVANAQQH